MSKFFLFLFGFPIVIAGALWAFVCDMFARGKLLYEIVSR